MASITDCVVEGLKYPFNDPKKLLGFGVLFALISAMSTIASFKSMDVFRFSMDAVEKTNSTITHMSVSQLPAGDVYLIIGLAIVSLIVAFFIMGYQYNIIKFSIDKRNDLPGFDDILGMFTKGIKYFLVTLAYNVIAILVLAAGTFFIKDYVVFLFVLLAFILFIIANFLLVMALSNMIAYDSLKKAFDFREIIDNIANLGWGKYIGIIIFTAIVYMIIMVAVSFILGFITVLFAATINNQAFVISIVIAIIEGLLIDSYAAVFYHRVCGSIYRESIK